jgi:cyclohexadienyl dehydratase
MRMRTIVALVLLALGAVPLAADEPRTLRVGTSGDYAPFSTAGPGEGEFTGFDIAVARAFAQDKGLALEFVSFRWPNLTAGLTSGRFDVAMSGVTVRPDRSTTGRFSVPVVETGAVLLARQPERWKTLDEVDRQDVRIGVNAGGHLERVARDRFKNATLVSIRDNDAVRRALLQEELHAAVTDTLEVPLWKGASEELVVLGPFTRDRKAYLVRNDRPGLAASLNLWLLARERDGTLASLRLEYFGAESTARFATPLGALLAAIDERLSLMPTVGAAKRRDVLPLEVPEREEAVLDAAVASARATAVRLGETPTPAPEIRALFRAQMEAAKEVQWNAIQDTAFEPPAVLPGLDSELRPALLRIGDRIVQLVLALPRDLDPERVRRAARDALRTPYLSQRSKLSIADTITATTRTASGN